MSENQEQNTAIAIDRPELWNLELGVCRDKLQYVLYARSGAQSLHWGEVGLDASAGYLQALGNAVYDHPLLLNDYGKVRIVASSNHFVILPHEALEREEDCALCLSEMFPDDDGDVCLCGLPQNELAVAYTLPRGVLNFLQRTFNMAPVFHHLHPLCEHFHRLNKGSDISRMFINLYDSSMDVVVYCRGALHMANNYSFRNADDAAYLVLHVWNEFKMEPLTDEVQLMGDKTLRNDIAPLLRKYINYVMPAIFPADAARLGHDAMKAPLNLMLLASCE